MVLVYALLVLPAGSTPTPCPAANFACCNDASSRHVWVLNKGEVTLVHKTQKNLEIDLVILCYARISAIDQISVSSQFSFLVYTRWFKYDWD